MSPVSKATSSFFSRWGHIALVIGIILLGAFFRFWHLHTLPPGLHPDEAANGFDVFRIIENHDFRPFYSFNGGREGLFFYFQSLGVLIFGNTIYGLRVAPAFLGTLAVAATYAWSSSWFGRRAGLIAAFLMAVTPWAVTISRDGFRASELELFVPLVLWLATVAFRSGKAWHFIAAGAALGLGFYTYIAWRLFPVALVAIGLYLLIWRRGFIKKWFKQITLAFVAMAVVLIPMGLYGLHSPGDIAGRPGGVSFTNPGLNHGHPWQTLADNVVKTALMFNIHGDENYRHNLGGQPMLNIFVGVMFLLGIFYSLTRLRDLRYAALLAVFGAMLLPEVLTAEGIPHALRAIGALAPTLVLATVGVDYLLTRWNTVFPINSAARLSGSAAVVVLLLLTAYQGYTQYFVAWASSQDTYDAYSEDSATAANYLNSHGFNGKRYAVAGEYQMFTVDFLTHHKASYTRVDPRDTASIPLDKGQAKEFLYFEHDKEAVLKQLKLKFPSGHISPHYSAFSNNELFQTYTVPAQ
ncbi:MAG TPA: glycosyltransferase family 39 protein [Candidatus Saccharimonadales bacterium]|nr:glycosyltransferase family 39 protein [Candidatus Saccharimonadales bacterium]